jgi:hypothetical protein
MHEGTRKEDARVETHGSARMSSMQLDKRVWRTLLPAQLRYASFACVVCTHVSYVGHALFGPTLRHERSWSHVASATSRIARGVASALSEWVSTVAELTVTIGGISQSHELEQPSSANKPTSCVFFIVRLLSNARRSITHATS